MEIQKVKAIIEAILFAAGRQVNIKEFIIALEIDREKIENIIIENIQGQDNRKHNIKYARRI